MLRRHIMATEDWYILAVNITLYVPVLSSPSTYLHKIESRDQGHVMKIIDLCLFEICRHKVQISWPVADAG